MYTSRMFDMWSQTKLEAHTPPLQTNVQANNAQTQSSGSIKGKLKLNYNYFISKRRNESMRPILQRLLG